MRLLIFIFIISSCFADEITLDNGTVWEGKIFNAKGGIIFKKGKSTFFFRYGEYKSVYIGPTKKEWMKANRPSSNDSVEVKIEYARWCVKNGFPDEALKHIQFISAGWGTNKIQRREAEEIEKKVEKIKKKKKAKEEARQDLFKRLKKQREAIKDRKKAKEIAGRIAKNKLQTKNKKRVYKKRKKRKIIRSRWIIVISYSGWNLRRR